MSVVSSIPSPFIGKIGECRTAMRKLRKKIYKYTTVHKQTIRKPKESVQDILGLLKTRDLPSYILDPIRKRRTFDIASLKNVVVSPGASLEEIVNRTNHQENQIQRLFSEHKNRMQNAQKKFSTPKFDKKSTLETLAGTQSQSHCEHETPTPHEDYGKTSRDYDSESDEYVSHYRNVMDPEISEFPDLDHLDHCSELNAIKLFQVHDPRELDHQESGYDHFLTL